LHVKTFIEKEKKKCLSAPNWKQFCLGKFWLNILKILFRKVES